jgi:hypothetical protein
MDDEYVPIHINQQGHGETMTGTSHEGTVVPRKTWRAAPHCRGPLSALLAPVLLAGCAGAPPDAVPGPIEPRVARLDDVATVPLPASDSAEYCSAAQQILAGTTLAGENTVFSDMPSYRHSKSAANPHRIYQVVTYAGAVPVVVSCKVKSAAHLRGVYGPEAAGEQRSCAALTARARDRAVAGLRAEGLGEAADRAAAYVLDDNEPYLTGQAYLGDFALSYVDDQGAVHLSSPGLFQNYDSWITRFLPWQVQGQHYCHTATSEYVRALATGALEPGTVITSADDAPVVPAPTG